MVENILDEREFNVLKLRLLEGKTLQDTGSHYGLSHEGIRKIQLKAEQKLKEEILKRIEID